MNIFTLNPKREKLPLSRHPWVFSGAIKDHSGNPQNGEIVRVETSDGKFIAYAHYSVQSKLQLRLLEWKEECKIDDNWWKQKFTQAFVSRVPLFKDQTTTTARLVFGENDFLPGLIVDRVGDYLVVQCATSGMVKSKEVLLKNLIEVYQEIFGNLKGIVERSDSDGCALEGLEPSSGLLWGTLPEEGLVYVLENGLSFGVNIQEGQKTGFYTDQRENRQIIAPWLKDRNVLDVCSYTGAFSIYALAHRASSVTLVDISENALLQAKKNLELNHFKNFEIISDNAFNFLRQARKEGKAAWNAIILDPPKLVPTRHDMVNGLRGYKDLNFQAISLLQPGDVLATFSCSGLVSMEKFKEVVIYAAKDAGKQIKILRQLHQAACHPIRFSFPEGEYLKGLLVQVCDS